MPIFPLQHEKADICNYRRGSYHLDPERDKGQKKVQEQIPSYRDRAREPEKRG